MHFLIIELDCSLIFLHLVVFFLRRNIYAASAFSLYRPNMNGFICSQFLSE
uniref:Uncharacterized protein n=1 Tax=Rhizophora mucronata TaxID=61149 RepID=A0A2P2NZY7_RHIMU